MNRERLFFLIDQVNQGSASNEELAEYNAYMNQRIANEGDWDSRLMGDEAATRAELFTRIEKAGAGISGDVRIRRLWPRIAAAACLLIGLSVGGYFLLPKATVQQTAQVRQDVAPYSKQAILKTGHGRTLILDSTRKGLLAQYGHTHIRQTGGGEISYSGENGAAGAPALFDTLQVPAGGKPYRLNLADGSAIIVNVASTLRYPENFRKNNNTLELISGEAYFSIVHNAKAPLTILAADQRIEDIGTEFNVNTYANEPDHRTTLVEGAVKVNTQRLVPGQQAIITGSRLTVATANVEQITAWKNGYFRFNGENIQTIMRELARWYNIEVRYEGNIAKEGYYIRISRAKNISEVLKALERTNSVHFKIEGRRISVSSKSKPNTLS